MDLLVDLKLALLDFNFAMIQIIHKMIALLRNHMNYLKHNIFQCFFKKYNRLLSCQIIFFSQHRMM